MGTLRGGYHLKDGTRVPSVTTILGRFKDAGPLMHWAWRMGCEGKDFRDVRDEAASAGTLAHEAVEAWARGEKPRFSGSEQVQQRAMSGYGAFLDWASRSRLRVDRTELPLVSEKHRFGGTFDAILVDGRRAMGDWKTSNGIYPEYLCQLAAYGLLWEENFPSEPIDGGYDLLRFDKNYGDFTHKHWNELDTARKAFLLLRELYDLEPELKARAK